MNRIREEDSDEEVGGGESKMDIEDVAPMRMPRRPRLPPRNFEVLDLPRPATSSSISTNNGNTVSLHMTKLPNLLGINPDAFDPATFDPDLEEREYRGYVHNMIRWRYKVDKDGNKMRDANNKLIRESNARFVRWSDGTCTIHVGGDEAFELDQNDSSDKKTGFPGLNGYLYLSQKASATKKDSDDEDEDGGKNSAGGNTVLECVGTIQSNMRARPSSLQSEAHKKLTLAVRQRNMKKARIAEYVTQVDPELEKNQRIKNREDLKKPMGKKRYGGGGARGRSRPAMSRRYLEEDDGNYDSIGLGAIKRRTMDGDDDMGRGGGGYGGYGGYGVDRDEDDDWDRRGKFQRGARKPVGRKYE
eukprot:5485831-Ditylum_brightwellii.AAC.1